MRKKIWLATFLIFVIIFGGSFWYIDSLLSSVEREEISDKDVDLGIEIVEITDEEKEERKNITNILLFGIDAEEGTSGRSDAIIILTVDEINDKIKLTSIMRDSYVDINGRGKDKVNHAYAYGGPQLAIKTINQNFNLDIRDYVSVNFTSLPILIDMVDGIEINIETAEVSHVPGINKPGMQKLNGDQALAYSRIRYLKGGDYARSQRQRDVLTALIKKGMKSPITSYPRLLSKGLPLLKTNLTSNEILSLGTKVVTKGITSVENHRFPEDKYGEGQMINGVYYIVFDEYKTAQNIRNYIYRDIRE